MQKVATPFLILKCWKILLQGCKRSKPARPCSFYLSLLFRLPVRQESPSWPVWRRRRKKIRINFVVMEAGRWLWIKGMRGNGEDRFFWLFYDLRKHKIYTRPVEMRCSRGRSQNAWPNVWFAFWARLKRNKTRRCRVKISILSTT